jgi:DNA polymerase III epsilon subunit family exonuclease
MAKPYTHLLVLDVETTGINPAVDSLIEIGACVLDRDDLREQGVFSTFVRPTSPISPEAYAVHGKSESDLAAAPSVSEALAAFVAFVPKDALLCGHNVAFDAAFIKAACAQNRLTYPFDYHLLDVWSLAYFIIGAEGSQLPSHSLDALCALYGINRGPKHAALEDAQATAAVLRNLLAIVKGKRVVAAAAPTAY